MAEPQQPPPLPVIKRLVYFNSENEFTHYMKSDWLEINNVSQICIPDRDAGLRRAVQAWAVKDTKNRQVLIRNETLLKYNLPYMAMVSRKIGSDESHIMLDLSKYVPHVKPFTLLTELATEYDAICVVPYDMDTHHFNYDKDRKLHPYLSDIPIADTGLLLATNGEHPIANPLMVGYPHAEWVYLSRKALDERYWLRTFRPDSEEQYNWVGTLRMMAAHQRGELKVGVLWAKNVLDRFTSDPVFTVTLPLPVQVHDITTSQEWIEYLKTNAISVRPTWTCTTAYKFKHVQQNAFPVISIREGDKCLSTNDYSTILYHGYRALKYCKPEMINVHVLRKMVNAYAENNKVETAIAFLTKLDDLNNSDTHMVHCELLYNLQRYNETLELVYHLQKKYAPIMKDGVMVKDSTEPSWVQNMLEMCYKEVTNSSETNENIEEEEEDEEEEHKVVA